MLLECWSIPHVIILMWFFLKTKYKFNKIVGVVICVAGLVLLVFSDVHAGDRSQCGSNPIKGYVLVIAWATLYAVCNVSEGCLVRFAVVSKCILLQLQCLAFLLLVFQSYQR